MLVPTKQLPILINYGFLSFFMPGQAETYMVEAIKRQFGVVQTADATGTSYRNLDSGENKISIDTKWRGIDRHTIELDFRHSNAKYYGDAKRDVQIDIYNLSLRFQEVAVGQLEVKGVHFSDDAVDLFDRYVRKDYNPNEEQIPDQIIYALMLSALSYTKDVPKQNISEFIGKGLFEGLGKLAEQVRQNQGLQYVDAFYEVAKLEGKGPDRYHLRPEVLWAIEAALKDYKKAQNLQGISQIDFLRLPQNAPDALQLKLAAPALAKS